ncbi:class I SAM-dependent methyltransferase [Kitasatospora sp. CM 4170]|uniref:Class I SAM-dependent methyltransferase n=1 Tax=Kitasatospora aburaviensis TaxID=67265 RepID=A0ABW1F7U8_9ACTN|nr:class I SAM-dependent methyltransferase [Kitasatospora sp. CM 4170]WNM43325.1 class I SAM-dependent methyltransferase [Kitasatospora sp. CM 4170]
MEREGFDVWAAGSSYDRYMGRWSRLVAEEFVAWLGCGDGLRWLDVGCGTGVLSAVLAARCRPRTVTGVDRSEAFVRSATTSTWGFVVGDAMALPLRAGSCDVAVSALTLNFLGDPAAAVTGMAAAVRPGGTVAAYVWDYAHGMGFLRRFWDAAVRADPSAAELDEGRRFPECRPDALRAQWAGAGLTDVSTVAIDVPVVFADFDDLWEPFLAGQGPAPAYVASLRPIDRDRLRDVLSTAVERGEDGSTGFTCRAWAVRGHKPDHLDADRATPL